ncbi:MAG: metal ABC transporter substrate-binding protein [Candidatus Bipolaricaulaceae bacterium]
MPGPTVALALSLAVAGILATGLSTGLGAPLNVVATTSILGDVVQQVGGERIELTLLLPPGTDPHTFDPSAREGRAVADADVVFMVGSGLEAEARLAGFLAGARGPVVAVAADGAPQDPRAAADPHVWLDPTQVGAWAERIAATLAKLSPDYAQEFHARAAAYADQLADLDEWIRGQVAELPPERRILIVDHLAFGYFAARYGFRQRAIVEGFSTLAEPSARELAAVEAAIRELSVPAVFATYGSSPVLPQRVAQDTGVQLVWLYAGTLSDPAGPAPTYLEMMRWNVSAVVAALDDQGEGSE